MTGERGITPQAQLLLPVSQPGHRPWALGGGTSTCHLLCEIRGRTSSHAGRGAPGGQGLRVCCSAHPRQCQEPRRLQGTHCTLSCGPGPSLSALAHRTTPGGLPTCGTRHQGGCNPESGLLGQGRTTPASNYPFRRENRIAPKDYQAPSQGTPGHGGGFPMGLSP